MMSLIYCSLLKFLTDPLFHNVPTVFVLLVLNYIVNTILTVVRLIIFPSDRTSDLLKGFRGGSWNNIQLDF